MTTVSRSIYRLNIIIWILPDFFENFKNTFPHDRIFLWTCSPTADSERKYGVMANCHVTPVKSKRDNSCSNLWTIKSDSLWITGFILHRNKSHYCCYRIEFQVHVHAVTFSLCLSISICITFRFAFITYQIVYMEINIWIELMELRMGLSILL